jgi:hypothetical protein
MQLRGGVRRQLGSRRISLACPYRICREGRGILSGLRGMRHGTWQTASVRGRPCAADRRRERVENTVFGIAILRHNTWRGDHADPAGHCAWLGHWINLNRSSFCGRIYNSPEGGGTASERGQQSSGRSAGSYSGLFGKTPAPGPSLASRIFYFHFIKILGKCVTEHGGHRQAE